MLTAALPPHAATPCPHVCGEGGWLHGRHRACVRARASKTNSPARHAAPTDLLRLAKEGGAPTPRSEDPSPTCLCFCFVWVSGCRFRFTADFFKLITQSPISGCFQFELIAQDLEIIRTECLKRLKSAEIREILFHDVGMPHLQDGSHLPM